MYIPVVNKTLFWITKVEMLILRLLNLPFGNSILIIVQKSRANLLIKLNEMIHLKSISHLCLSELKQYYL